MSESATLLPDGVEVPFAEASALLTRNLEQRGGPDSKALITTIVAIGPEPRLKEAAETLERLGSTAGVRAILISEGDRPAPAVWVSGCAIALAGIKPQYLNNAVAALRLSSLPTLVWWRGGQPKILDGLAHLADRVVLDAEEPEESWARAARLLDRSAFSDLRWARLTRWRALLAHFFDVASVRESARAFDVVDICGGDRPSARLLASWLSSALGWGERVTPDLRITPGAGPIEDVRLKGPVLELTLRVADSRTCLESSSTEPRHGRTSRAVELGDQSLDALLTQEMRIRAHDVAFERTIRAMTKV